VRRIVGNEQTDWSARCAERLSELNGGIATNGMADDSDWLQVAAVFGNRLIGYTAPARM